MTFISNTKGIYSKYARSIIILLLLFLPTFASVYGQSLKSNNITIKVNKESIEQVFTILNRETNYKFFYDKQVISDVSLISLDFRNANLKTILAEIGQKTQLQFTTIDNTITVSKSRTTGPGPQQARLITGVIVDEYGEPIIGANIFEKSTASNGTTTDMDGKFSLRIDEQAVLIISYVGYETQEISVSGKSSLHIKMLENTKGIDEVVVIGYGTARKKDVTGALSRVNVAEQSTLPNVNAVQALRGTVAGLRVVDTGKAGTDGTIQIRGTTSISASNDPLIVLDGVPFSGGRLSDINTNDIETIDILKDASSTAIYGSRGANGVILITTKKGQTTKPQLSYNGYVGFSDFANMPKMMGAEKYKQLRKDAEAYMNQSLPFQTIEEENMAAGRTINPWSVIEQDAPMTEHELSMSGKGEKVTYYLSGSFTSQKSPLAGDEFKRITVRANFDVNVTDWLQIGTNSSFATKDFSGNDASWGNAGYLSPFSSIRYDDGTLRYLPYGDGMVSNPLWNVEMKDNEEISYGIFNSNFVIVKLPLKGLTYQMNLSNNLRFKDVKNYTPAYDRDGQVWMGSGDKSHSFSYDLIWENMLKYNQTFAQQHNVDVTLMYGYESSKANSTKSSANNIFNDALGWDGLGIGENPTITTTASESAAVSSMARLGYRFADKYMINATVRRDGYSAFGSDRKYGTFPSIGLGWAISQEKFMEKITWIDFLKLRASWGKNGNRAISSYASLSTMGIVRYIFGDGGSTIIGLSPSSMANPLLGWETSRSYNAGIDFNLLNNRLSGSVDVYKTKTTDLLLEVSVPNMSGYDVFMTNIGETENRGIEISLQSENIKTSQFSWTTSVNFSSNKNKILHLTGKDLDGDGKEDDDIGKGRFIGYSMGSHFNYVFDGIWQEGDDFTIDPTAKPGDIKFKDVDGNGSIGPEDRVVLHNNRPKFMMSMNNMLRYRDFSLSFLFDFRYGGYAGNSWINPGTNFYNRCNQLDLPYWTPENPINDRPSVGYSNPRGYGFYEKLTYLRLQDLTLSYNIPRTILDKIHVGGVKIYISGKNLATWTGWHGYDPEHASGGRASSNGPLIKSWVLGLQINL